MPCIMMPGLFSSWSYAPFIVSRLIGPSSVTERTSYDQCLGLSDDIAVAANLFRLRNRPDSN